MNARHDGSREGGGRDDDDAVRRVSVDVNFGEPGGWIFFTILIVLVYRCNGVGLW